MSALWPFLLPADRHDDPALRAVSAAGTRIRFADGTEALCGTSGLWNVNLGYGNPVIADAVAETLHSSSYLTLFRYEHEHARHAAEALVDVSGSEHYGKVMYSTSGGAANDLAMKLARQYHALRGARERRLVVALRGSYHGLTFGGFALTGEDLGQRVYGVDQRLVRHVAPNDVEDLERLLALQGELVAAVVVEPVLGTGAVALHDRYVAELLRLREEHGFLLVADEVATGFGRTGSFFASHRWPGRPDVLIASKGLTNGTCAASAVIVSHELASAFKETGAVLSHGETQAGTPPTCAAILATISEMRRLDAVARAQELSALLDHELAALVRDHPAVSGSAGLGCFRAITLRAADGNPLPHNEVPAVVSAIRKAGAVVHPGPHGIQLIPALTYPAGELTELMASVRSGLDAVVT